MKMVSLLLVAVLATLAWANPSYFQAEDTDDQDVQYPLQVCAMEQHILGINNLFHRANIMKSMWQTSPMGPTKMQQLKIFAILQR